LDKSLPKNLRFFGGSVLLHQPSVGDRARSLLPSPNLIIRLGSGKGGFVSRFLEIEEKREKAKLAKKP
jgi:hypothetical protein